MNEWLRVHRKQLLVHGVILITFLLFVVFMAVPLFDRFGPAEIGTSRLRTVQLPVHTDGMYYRLWGRVRSTGVELMGYAFILGQSAEGSEFFVVLQSADKTYAFETFLFPMPDITGLFGNLGLDLDDSSFYAIVPARRIEEGTYEVSIYLQKGDIEALQRTDNVLIKAGNSLELTVRVSKAQGISLPPESQNLILSIDVCERVVNEEREFLEVTGWAFIEEQSAEDSSIYVVLKSETATYVFDTIQQSRPDVTAYFEELGLNLENSGFVARIPVTDVEKGIYQLGIYIEKADIEALHYTDRTVDF